MRRCNRTYHASHHSTTLWLRRAPPHAAALLEATKGCVGCTGKKNGMYGSSEGSNARPRRAGTGGAFRDAPRAAAEVVQKLPGGRAKRWAERPRGGIDVCMGRTPLSPPLAPVCCSSDLLTAYFQPASAQRPANSCQILPKCGRQQPLGVSIAAQKHSSHAKMRKGGGAPSGMQRRRQQRRRAMCCKKLNTR